jgi:hypothetical protein
MDKDHRARTFLIQLMRTAFGILLSDLPLRIDRMVVSFPARLPFFGPCEIGGRFVPQH